MFRASKLKRPTRFHFRLDMCAIHFFVFYIWSTCYGRFSSSHLHRSLWTVFFRHAEKTMFVSASIFVGKVPNPTFAPSSTFLRSSARGNSTPRFHFLRAHILSEHSLFYLSNFWYPPFPAAKCMCVGAACFQSVCCCQDSCDLSWRVHICENPQERFFVVRAVSAKALSFYDLSSFLALRNRADVARWISDLPNRGWKHF